MICLVSIVLSRMAGDEDLADPYVLFYLILSG